MKERPILFSAPMVRAILEGRKTQTRRIIKPQPSINCDSMKSDDVNEAWQAGFVPIDCLHGKVGERLWVRETWRPDCKDDVCTISFQADGAHVPIRDDYGWAERWVMLRRPEEQWPKMEEPKWRPSIHMPRWASRINLEIVSIRVERLNDISQKDAMAEGAPPSHPTIDAVSREFGYPDFSRSWFAQLWESINGQGSWNQNPWVWVIEFKRV